MLAPTVEGSHTALREACSPWAVLPDAQLPGLTTNLKPKKSPETSVWSPRAGLSPGCDSAPVDVCRGLESFVFGAARVGDHLAWECCVAPLAPGPAPSRKLPTPTLSVRGLPTVRGPSRMLKALPLRLSPPKRNTASVPSEECGRI